MIKVILDPGHQAKVLGKRSPDGRLLEYKWNRELTKIIEERLDKLGIPHQRTTGPEEDNGKEIGLTNRCIRANNIAKKSDIPTIFVSIHVNAAGNGEWKSARGWSVFVSPNSSSKSKKLASYMAAMARNRDIKVRVPSRVNDYWTANYTVLSKTSMPAVLVENLFMDNKEDLEILLSEEGKKKLAEVIIEAICLYAGVEYK